MTDREILELAAKAAGYEIHKGWQDEREALGHGDAGLWIKNGPTCWNPLTNRSDAFSLMVKLGMDLEVDYVAEGSVNVRAWATYKHPNGVTYDGAARANGPADQAEALTMHAITLCAAEVGRAMG